MDKAAAAAAAGTPRHASCTSMMRSLASTATAVGWSKYSPRGVDGIELADDQRLLASGRVDVDEPRRRPSSRPVGDQQVAVGQRGRLSSRRVEVCRCRVRPHVVHGGAPSLPVVGLTSMMPPPVPERHRVASTKMSPAASVVIPLARSQGVWLEEVVDGIAFDGDHVFPCRSWGRLRSPCRGSVPPQSATRISPSGAIVGAGRLVEVLARRVDRHRVRRQHGLGAESPGRPGSRRRSHRCSFRPCCTCWRRGCRRRRRS